MDGVPEPRLERSAPLDVSAVPPTGRSFLFLQGPATPFFARLGHALAARGHRVTRVNFNGGDRLYWRGVAGGLDFRGRLADWPAFLDRALAERAVTDLVVFGDCRPVHAAAIPVAHARDVAVHVLDEAYLRPSYITLERDGTNGRSTLPRDPDWYRAAAAALPPFESGPVIETSFARRVVDDVAYNVAVELHRWRYPHYRTHRPWWSMREYGGWLRRAARRPFTVPASATAVRRFATGTAPYYLFPLQLDCDYQIRAHSPFASVGDAIALVVASFARAAPADALLAIKGHPLDNGLTDWGRATRRAARAHGVADRVGFVAEAVYGPLLEPARAVVTINSTAGIQAVGVGKPVIALGHAIYAIPGLTWQGSLDAFWGAAAAGEALPDMTLLDAFRRVLADRCLVRGGFFGARSEAVGVASAVARLEAAEPAPA